jgi:hypothetical protein
MCSRSDEFGTLDVSLAAGASLIALAALCATHRSAILWLVPPS